MWQALLGSAWCGFRGRSWGGGGPRAPRLISVHEPVRVGDVMMNGVSHGWQVRALDLSRPSNTWVLAAVPVSEQFRTRHQ